MFNERRILEALMDRSGAYADIYVDTRNYTLIQLESGKVEKLEQGEDAGVGLRIIDPWRTYYASTNSFDEARLVALAQKLSGYTGSRTGETVAISEKKTRASYPFSIARDPAALM
jgi:TldD protein